MRGVGRRGTESARLERLGKTGGAAMQVRLSIVTVGVSVWLASLSVQGGEGTGMTHASVNGVGTEATQSVQSPYLEVLRRYIRGCNTGDVELLKSTFTDDIKVYFVELPPVEGRDTVAKFW